MDHMVFVLKDGTALGIGDNRSQQIRAGDPVIHDKCVRVGFKGNHLVRAYCGSKYTVYLTNKGSTFLTGSLSKAGRPCAGGFDNPIVYIS